MSSKTISLKISEELATEWETHKQEHGGTSQESFVALLKAYQGQEREPTDDSPFGTEERRLSQLLNEAKGVAMAYMTLAENDKQVKLKEMSDAVVSAQATISTLEAGLTEANMRAEALTEKNRELGEVVENLKGSAENIKELKTAWDGQEKALRDQIISLNGEAQESRDLKNQLAGAREEVTKKADTVKTLESKLALADQASKNNLDTILDLKARIEEAKNNLTAASDDVRRTNADYKEAAQKINVITSEASEAASLAMVKNFELSGQIKEKAAQILVMTKEINRLKKTQQKSPKQQKNG